MAMQMADENRSATGPGGTDRKTAGRIFPADAFSVAGAAGHLRDGRLVVFPTETVYGLGANARSDDAVLQIFEAKGRPRFNPLIVHVASLDAAQKFADFGPRALVLARAFWPGPLTLVLPRKPDAELSDLVTAGLDTIALRVPGHPMAQALLAEAGVPVAAPSANLSGRVSPTQMAHIDKEMLGGHIAAILDGGPTQAGIESAIVACLPGEPLRLLRPGSVTRSEIEKLTGETVNNAETGKISAPGQLQRHYAPLARLRLNAKAAKPGEAFVAFGAPLRGSNVTANLSPSGDLREAAAHLFSTLHQLDAKGITRAAVMPIPNDGLGEAINDRLTRAAAPRK